ncbi:hypothetical protein GALMADRAFT_147205 [Galerina marginata CBS 339.88]|uniref:Uncharacterized protein n=1 Tax=Galerina marginata (strain CBS 339.88) TaxID=685588 RepID=A0A067SBY0_GALM3|nr:hypothetical protein GALMADRAFT_147205 [Galerina marginata CBS 339.88]
MTSPGVVYIDDRDPVVVYKPNWNRGGNASDYLSTSTSTHVPGSTANLSFSGTGVSVWGTVQVLNPNEPSNVLLSFSVDDGPPMTHNIAELPVFQFQQNVFQSDSLAPSTHTLVVTLENRASFFLDYFLVIPLDSTSSTTLAATTSPSAPPTTSEPSLSHPSPTMSAVADANFHSKGVPIDTIVGGTLGGFALLCIAILAVWLGYQRGKSKGNDNRLPQPFNPTSSMDQFRAQSSNTPIISHLPLMHPILHIPPLKGSQRAQLSSTHPVQVENNWDLYTLSGQTEPPRYDG